MPDEDDFGLFREINHSFLRERGPDDVSSQVFSPRRRLAFTSRRLWLLFFGDGCGGRKKPETRPLARKAYAPEGMLPGFQQVYMIESDFSFRKKQGKDFRSKDILRIFT